MCVCVCVCVSERAISPGGIRRLFPVHLFDNRIPSKPILGRLRGLVSSALDHRSLPPEF